MCWLRSSSVSNAVRHSSQRYIHESPPSELYSLLYTLALNILAVLPPPQDNKQPHSQENPLCNSVMGQALHISLSLIIFLDIYSSGTFITTEHGHSSLQ